MASTNVLVHLNFNGNEIQNVLAQKLATAPSNPAAGQFYYNTTDNTLYVYNGTTWLNALAQGTTYTNGTGITINGTTISVDFSAVATAAQGALADSALQSGDNISELTNDAGYITGITSADVTSALGYTPVPNTRTINGEALTGNITLDASDVGALADTTKYGATLTFTVDPTTYVLTATLKDQDGNTLGTAQTVDLPLESVVVNGSYDSTNKQIVLTLENGNTIDIPVADLVAGLQSEITASNMLSADLVDDTSTTHKFATAAQLTQIATNASNISGLQTALDNLPQYIEVTNPALTPTGGVCVWTLETANGEIITDVVSAKVFDINGNEVIVGLSAGAITINSTTNIAANTYTAKVFYK